MSNLDFRDPKSTPSQLDDLIAQAAGSVLRHGLTALAGALGTLGALSSDQQTQFVAVGGALAMWGVGLLWSVIQKARAKKA